MTEHRAIIVANAVLALCAVIALGISLYTAHAAHVSAVAAQDSAKRAGDANVIASQALDLARRAEQTDVPLLVMDNCHTERDMLPNSFMVGFKDGRYSHGRTRNEVVQSSYDLYDCRVRNIGTRVAARVHVTINFRYNYYRGDDAPRPDFVAKQQHAEFFLSALEPNNAEQIHFYFVNLDERFPVILSPSDSVTYYDAKAGKDITTTYTIGASNEVLLHSKKGGIGTP
ncbi:MAG TPA: hypothetical protein VN224_02995 [Xanthomonadales bacterium]|nr:hypothetical protein [Xanthomonadales bacterium]